MAGVRKEVKGEKTEAECGEKKEEMEEGRMVGRRRYNAR